MACTNALDHTVDNTSAQLPKHHEKKAHTYRSETVPKDSISKELKARVRADLVYDWHWQRKWGHREALRLEWAPVDTERILLQDLTGQISPSRVKLLANRTTAFYWLQEAQKPDANGEKRINGKLILAIIHGRWYESFQGNPNIEYGNFLANCVRVAPTGPSTIREIIDAHLSLCAQASHLLSPDQCSTRNQHRLLLPSYWSVILVIDSIQYDLVPFDTNNRQSLSEVAATQTVLIVRTGVEAGLGTPISFAGLTSLPHNRSDLAGIDAVRVSLNTAIDFIVGLEKYQMSRTSRSQSQPPVDASICPMNSHTYQGDPHVDLNPETWADAILGEAEKHGYDSQPNTRHALRRIQARSLGEDDVAPEFIMWSSLYKP